MKTIKQREMEDVKREAPWQQVLPPIIVREKKEISVMISLLDRAGECNRNGIPHQAEKKKTIGGLFFPGTGSTGLISIGR